MDPLLSGICTHCGQNGYDCKCDSFHPNVIAKRVFELSLEEAMALKDFILKSGYISPEFHPMINDIYNRLDRFINKS